MKIMEYNGYIDSSESDDIALEMECQLLNNPIKKERLRKIPGTNTYANSLNVFVGRQRTGKTYHLLYIFICD